VGLVETVVEVEAKIVVGLMASIAVEAVIELEVVLPAVVIVKANSELVVTTEDKSDVRAEVELETTLVKGTEELGLLDSWYSTSSVRSGLHRPPYCSLYKAYCLRRDFASATKPENQNGVCRSLTSQAIVMWTATSSRDVGGWRPESGIPFCCDA
jgi:hypothetical protein